VWPDGFQPTQQIWDGDAVRSYLSLVPQCAEKKPNRSFDLCDLTGAPQAFFPGNRLAMLGVFEEVPCECWNGVVGPELWKGSCLPDNPPLWPSTGCGNEGTMHSLP
jgi:hypothetical protein